MTGSAVHPLGWISVAITGANERRARAIRAERDRQYGNIFTEESTDERWVGDLGEMAFDNWFRHRKVEGYAWILERAAGAPDFVTRRGVRIGVKTVKRAVPPRPGYTAQITARHAHEPIDQFFFMSYEIDRKTMWLLGGIEKASFLAHARHYQAGDQVHPNYTVRKGHDIYNIDIGKLAAPVEWIERVS